MAWPYSAHTPFVANTTRIASTFLNDIQTYISHLFNGTYRVKKLEVNSAGGASTTAGAGEIVAAGLIESSTQVNGPKLLAFGARSSATPGSGQSVAAGEVWKDTVISAWGKFRVTAGPAITFDRGANVASVVLTGTGIYTVTLQTAVANVQCINVTAMDSAAGIVVVDSGNVSGLAPTTSVFRILYSDAAGIPSDPAGNVGGFFFQVIGG